MATRPASTSPSSDLTFGIALAMSSSLAIGSSFIVKKKGLKLASARGGLRAGSGGFGYLREPLWWGGMITMIVGEVANFAAYAYAPAVIVTPLGALSIIVAAVLSHHILRERLNGFGWLGCFLCVVGSLSVVMHAPEDRPIRDVRQLWEMASAPTFATYAAFATCLTSYLITSVYPRVGEKVLVVPIGICSLAGSLSVMGVKALGIALRLTWAGSNQFAYAETWACVAVVAACVVTQMNYLNKALDVFNAAVVTPVYYVGFTTLTLLASSVMFKDYERQSAVEVTSQLCGFATILSGVFVLHVTKDVRAGGMGPPGGGGGKEKRGGGLGMVGERSSRESLLEMGAGVGVGGGGGGSPGGALLRQSSGLAKSDSGGEIRPAYE